jgi:epoxyqueuosine reductase
MRAGIGNRVFGCDICQEVCPWNERFARPTTEPAYSPRAGLESPALIDLAARLLAVDDAGFREMFRGSPISRARREGMLRNVCVALGNWGSEDAVPTLQRALLDVSPLVRAHAAWALGRVGTATASASLSAARAVETDDAVSSEIEAALGLGKPD